MPVLIFSWSVFCVSEVPILSVSSLQDIIAIAVNAIAVNNLSLIYSSVDIYISLFGLLGEQLLIECLVGIGKVLLIAKHRDIFSLSKLHKVLINLFVCRNHTIAISNGEFGELVKIKDIFVVLQQLGTRITELQALFEVATQVFSRL